MKRLLLLIFLGLSAIVANAATFTVTSNADAGLGSLRDAINSANANGTATMDYIYFNLPGSILTDISIALETELPILTSNIVIDGTTQPFAALANPNIKINLVRVVLDYFNGLRLDNAQNVEIYGISFNNFKSDPLGPIEEKKGAIYLYKSSNIIIGAPNKPNCFTGNYAGILSPFIIPRFDIENIKISSNIFGLAENGLTTSPNETGIDLSFLKNSVIGGDTPAEGNLISSNTRNGIALGGATGTIKVANNIIGLDKTLIKSMPSLAANGIYMNGEGSIPSIINNYICSQKQGILLDYANGGFIVAGNRIGTGPTGGENFSNETGIHVNFCNKGMIGGATIADENKIAYNKTGVLIEIAYPISMLKNSFYCNTAAITFKNLPPGKAVTQSRISTITANSASGIYLPNSIVELFYTDSCPDCQGKTWLTTVTTDAAGAWNYSGPINGKITSMGTNPDGATSTFSKPLIIETNVNALGVYCGQSNGSITGMEVYDSSVLQWYDANGVPVPGATQKDLTNVGAGTYYLKAGQLGNCDATSSKYTIDASNNGISDQHKNIKDVYCGAADGYIKNIAIANNLPRVWYNSSGQIVGTDPDLENVPAGNYYFKAGQGNCEIVSTIYPIKNIIITYKVKTATIVPATCGNANGRVSINTYETDKPDTFKWYDQQNIEVSSNENLVNFAPGKYTLIGFGNNGCSNTIGDFEITEAPLPIINYSNLQQYISCDGKSIYTLGITVDGSTAPYTAQWLNEDGDVVSNQLNISNVAAGKYTLQVIDKNGCTVVGRLLDFSLLQASILNIPNSITPNGDGVNDLWQINGMENYPFADISIYGRDGNRIFYSRGYGKPFDGAFKGKTLPIGVYYYVIDLKTSCGTISGSLTLIR